MCPRTLQSRREEKRKTAAVLAFIHGPRLERSQKRPRAAAVAAALEVQEDPLGARALLAEDPALAFAVQAAAARLAAQQPVTPVQPDEVRRPPPISASHAVRC